MKQLDRDAICLQIDQNSNVIHNASYLVTGMRQEVIMYEEEKMQLLMQKAAILT
jgi:hypothetical protein